ncbi:hypothetical protein D3OALGA1CA_4972 [Olavius algarvensis associated proteobacterium Delta 3]|nr:hypothetical protein D3OALGA1CA_4972 [Olavius algarvensis associated proteobacterium Delta 3]
MKKTLTILALTAVMALFLVSSATAGSTLDRIKKKGELVVGITGSQPPLNATAKDGRILGLEGDLARLMASGMGVEVKFVKKPFNKLLPALESGMVDVIMSSMTMTPKRNLNVAFVGPYYISGKGILTKYEHIGKLQKPQGLNSPDFRVVTLKDSTSEAFVKSAASNAKLVTVGSYKEGLDKLMKNEVEALVADYPYCAVSAFRYQDKGLTAGESRLTFEPIGVAMPEDTLLINWTTNFLNALQASGTLEGLTKKWFTDGSWLKELPE